MHFFGEYSVDATFNNSNVFATNGYLMSTRRFDSY